MFGDGDSEGEVDPADIDHQSGQNHTQERAVVPSQDAYGNVSWVFETGSDRA